MFDHSACRGEADDDRRRLVCCSRKMTASDRRLRNFLCYLCRHGAVQHELAMDRDGWLVVRNVRGLRQCRDMGWHDLRRIVEDTRGRLELSDDGLWIRAVQGHSLPVSDDGLFERVTVEDLPALIIHGTTEEAWLMIRTQGISPMSRQHVHFVTTAAQVKRDCVVHIYVDKDRFLERGHLLLRARNGLILSRGHVPPAFFASAWHTRRRIDLLRATDADWLQPEAMSRWQADASGGGCARWDGWQADADGGGWERWSSWQADASGGGGCWSSWRADAGGGGWEPECEQEPCIEARSCSWP